MKNLGKWLKSLLGPKTITIGDVSPSQSLATNDYQVAQKTPMAQYSPSPVQTPISQYQESIPSLDNDTLQKMIKVYGGEKSKLSQFSQQLANATKHDFWKNNPELLALIPHLETNSGKYITRPNNLTNWGINYPGNNEEFAKMTEEQVLERFLLGLAQNSPYYDQFRTGKPLSDEELLSFANVYEPANPSYGPNLVSGKKHIRKTLGWD